MAKSTTPKKVLIVDDDELIRKLLELFLGGLGPFEYWEESNGQGALSLARQIRPDLIITDLSMPTMDGVQMIEELRKDPDEHLKKVPVIIVTGAGEELRMAAYKAGASVVLEKPLVRKLMVTALKKVLP